MIFFRAFQHLLPRGRAWVVVVEKRLRQFFEGLSGVGSEAKQFVDDVWADLYPKTTRDLAGWEKQYGLPSVGLTEQQRRDRLAAAWKAQGGQDPRYIEDTLQANGFDVYVHEWWQPGTEPAVGVQGQATPRNPLLYVREEFTGVRLLVECGEEFAACGEEFAEAGNALQPSGFPLVNKITQTVPAYLPRCGEDLAACGEDLAACGNFDVFSTEGVNYIVSRDPKFWPYFLYIGGETFGEIAGVDPKRQSEFEALCLKICPTQQWLGILVEYS